MLSSLPTNQAQKHKTFSNNKLHDSSQLNCFNLVIKNEKQLLKPTQFTLKDILTKKTKNNFSESSVTRSDLEKIDLVTPLKIHKNDNSSKEQIFSQGYKHKNNSTFHDNDFLFVHIKVGQLTSNKVDLVQFSNEINKCKINAKHCLIKELKKQELTLFMITVVVICENENPVIKLKSSATAVNKFNKENIQKINLQKNTRLMFGMRRVKIDRKYNLQLSQMQWDISLKVHCTYKYQQIAKSSSSMFCRNKVKDSEIWSIFCEYHCFKQSPLLYFVFRTFFYELTSLFYTMPIKKE